jgi:hypothetical protein
MVDLSSIAALMFVGALFLTLVFGRRASSPPLDDDCDDDAEGR